MGSPIVVRGCLPAIRLLPDAGTQGGRMAAPCHRIAGILRARCAFLLPNLETENTLIRELRSHAAEALGSVLRAAATDTDTERVDRDADPAAIGMPLGLASRSESGKVLRETTARQPPPGFARHTIAEEPSASGAGRCPITASATSSPCPAASGTSIPSSIRSMPAPTRSRRGSDHDTWTHPQNERKRL